MNQTCKVCGEPAAGFHFGAFTCEGCKSFFGRSYNNLSSISECKNNGKCIIDKKNRTTCKACRLRKCYNVGMSKGGSRYGRRSNWFKIHCLLQEQQQQHAAEVAGKGGIVNGSHAAAFGDMSTAAAVAAQQRMQQQHASHLVAAQHMGGLLGYPSYLPEMMQTSPFMSAAAAAARHPADAAAAAAALPLFSIMNSLPSIGSPQSAFQIPPHLLFPASYHPGGAAAADAAYHSEIYKHRSSVDSAASVGSPAYTPSEEEIEHITVCKSPELSVMSAHSPITAHKIHSPIAIRPTPNAISPITTDTAITSQHSETQSQSHTSESEHAAHNTVLSQSNSNAFSVNIQSLSPVSVCSISAETAAEPACSNTTTKSSSVNAQDCPMDLSMKTSRNSVHSFHASAGESDVQSDSSIEESIHAQTAARRKFYHISSEHETSDTSSDASSTSEAVKRQKLAVETASQSYNGFASSATSVRGIFVCV